MFSIVAVKLYYAAGTIYGVEVMEVRSSLHHLKILYEICFYLYLYLLINYNTKDQIFMQNCIFLFHVPNPMKISYRYSNKIIDQYFKQSFILHKIACFRVFVFKCTFKMLFYQNTIFCIITDIIDINL